MSFEIVLELLYKNRGKSLNFEKNVEVVMKIVENFPKTNKTSKKL